MRKRVPAGEMRHPVTIKEHKIESGSTAVDEYGQISASSTAWRTRVNARAKIEQLAGEELTLARQIYPLATYQMTIDYNSILASTGGTRRALVFDSRYFNIGAVIDPDMEKRQLQLLCGEER